MESKQEVNTKCREETAQDREVRDHAVLVLEEAQELAAWEG